MILNYQMEEQEQLNNLPQMKQLILRTVVD